MPVQVVATVRLDRQQIAEMLTGAGGPVVKAVQRGAGRGRDHAKGILTAGGFVDTGQLRNQIEASVTVRGDEVVGRVTSHAAHSIFVHDGTRSPIVPRRARALRFRIRGGPVIFATSVRGTKETGRYVPFLTDALERLTIGDFL